MFMFFFYAQKIFDNYLVAIFKSKVTSKLSKPANVGMCILYLSKKYCTSSIIITLKINTVTNQDYYSLIFIVVYMKPKPKMFMKFLIKIKKCLTLVII